MTDLELWLVPCGTAFKSLVYAESSTFYTIWKISSRLLRNNFSALSSIKLIIVSLRGTGKNFWMNRSSLPFNVLASWNGGGRAPSRSTHRVCLLNCVRDFTRYLRIFTTLAINWRVATRKEGKRFFALKDSAAALGRNFHVAGTSRKVHYGTWQANTRGERAIAGKYCVTLR